MLSTKIDSEEFGKGGIRTPGDHEATLVFKTRAFNHSATFPKNVDELYNKD